MKSIIQLAAILASIALIPSCKKKEDSKCSAGSGGNVTIVAYPQHHGKDVRPYKAYVKYGTKDAPSNLSSYDFTKDADTTENHIELTGLKCGDYYIYLTGYDTSVKAGVKGGIPYSLPENATGETSVYIPITE